jgi:hypothetical protein
MPRDNQLKRLSDRSARDAEASRNTGFVMLGPGFYFTDQNPFFEVRCNG